MVYNAKSPVYANDALTTDISLRDVTLIEGKHIFVDN